MGLVLALLRGAIRDRSDLVAENLLLRHQLAVLTRPTRRRPRLRARDRLLWVLARLKGAQTPIGQREPQAAARSYSWMSPPSRSRRTTAPTDPGGWPRGSAARRPRERCGRAWL